MGAAIEVRAVHHRYPGGVASLAGVDLSVPSGGFVAVVGPSGCGKSTLLRLIAGLQQPSAGEVLADGQPAIRPGRAAYQPQRDVLLPWRRAIANAALGAEVTGTPRRVARDRARREFARFGLAGFERAWPAQLSGGMRQRLALLRTFLLPMPILLLDEPFGALDPITRRGLYGWLQQVWVDDGRSVVLVTHDVEEALFLADEVVVLSARPGRVVHRIAVPEARPRDPVILAGASMVARRAEALTALALPP